jgi:hypothetical protein
LHYFEAEVTTLDRCLVVGQFDQRGESASLTLQAAIVAKYAER